MKKNSIFTILGLAFVLFTVSCSKSDPTPAPNNTSAGKWNGTLQYGTSGGNTPYLLSLNFKAGGTVDIVGYNGVATDTGTGTWQVVADSVRATFSYIASSAIYTLSGKYSLNSNIMAGTFGLAQQHQV